LTGFSADLQLDEANLSQPNAGIPRQLDLPGLVVVLGQIDRIATNGLGGAPNRWKSAE
jgi:hypothetical protein